MKRNYEFVINGNRNERMIVKEVFQKVLGHEVVASRFTLDTINGEESIGYYYPIKTTKKVYRQIMDTFDRIGVKVYEGVLVNTVIFNSKTA